MLVQNYIFPNSIEEKPRVLLELLDTKPQILKEGKQNKNSDYTWIVGYETSDSHRMKTELAPILKSTGFDWTT